MMTAGWLAADVCVIQPYPELPITVTSQHLPDALAQSVIAAELRRWRTASLNGPLSEYFYEDREPRRQNRPAVLIFDFNDELSSIGIR